MKAGFCILLESFRSWFCFLEILALALGGLGILCLNFWDLVLANARRPGKKWDETHGVLSEFIYGAIGSS